MHRPPKPQERQCKRRLQKGPKRQTPSDPRLKEYNHNMTPAFANKNCQPSKPYQASNANTSYFGASSQIATYSEPGGTGIWT